MSTFLDQSFKCPACGHPDVFRVIESANAGRHPAFARSVRDGTFMRYNCPDCKGSFLLEHQVLYVDFKQGHFVVVLPQKERVRALEHTKMAQQTWDDVRADEAAQVTGVGEGIEPRLVFGYGELREKVIGHDAGLDDRTVEAVKIRLRQEHPEWKIEGLMLDRVDEEYLVFAHLYEGPPMETKVRRVAFQRMQRQRPFWKPLLPALFSDPWVSARRYC